MGRRKRLCELYHESGSSFGNDLGSYLAAPHSDVLPRRLTRDDHVIRPGFGVGFGHWFFFDALEPALAFGRAARMSADCHGYGVYAAAVEIMFCGRHRTDERVLLLTGDNLERRDDEVEALKRFVQGVKEHPWSSHWRGLTGHITDYNNGQPLTTRRPSLPL